tara:strand:+ start:24130 stop:24375 length:246 start_codon:yes stop_codon:yes gene_type:complete
MSIRNCVKKASLVINVVENGVAIDAIPFEQGVIGRKYVFTDQVAFQKFMGEWYDTCVPKYPPIISSEERPELCRTHGNKDN